MFGRKIKTRLDLLKDFGGRSQDQKKYFQEKREAIFEKGEMCHARDYRKSNKKGWV